ncbi:hypothetical protein NCCP436_28930 [Pseudomonas sp. NCCP-436]|nr:hypothetical protein NCCP436_28930 [Pseudomonas sp. NCCP-436]
MPFYLRTGKRMPQKLSQIVIHFKAPPHYIFAPEQRQLIGNKLIIRLQPDEGIALQVLTKDQGLDKGMQLRSGPLQLSFSDTYRSARIPDAYERLLLEVLRSGGFFFIPGSGPDQWQHLFAYQWGEGFRQCFARRQPVQLLQFGSRTDGVGQAGTEQTGLHPATGFIGSLGFETAKGAQGAGRQLQLELFLQLALQRSEGVLAWFRLAAGQHQGKGITLANEQEPAFGIKQAGGGNGDFAGHLLSGGVVEVVKIVAQ